MEENKMMTSWRVWKARRKVLAAFVVAMGVGWGCADRNSSGESEAQKVKAPVEPSERSTDSQVGDVDWDDARSHRRISSDRLSEEAAMSVERSSVPVLLPDDDALLEGVHITVGDDWYAASMSNEDHTVLFNGTRRFHQMPGSGGKKEEVDRRPAEYSISRTHGIVTMTFEDFGVAYSVDVECKMPLENPLCTEDDYVISLVEGAGVVEGGQ